MGDITGESDKLEIVKKNVKEWERDEASTKHLGNGTGLLDIVRWSVDTVYIPVWNALK